MLEERTGTHEEIDRIGTPAMKSLKHFPHARKRPNLAENLNKQIKLTSLLMVGRVKAVYKPSGPPGRSLSRFPYHEATRSISTPPWMGC